MSQINRFVSAAGMGAVVTLRGNSGGKVPPDGTGNIDVVGSGNVTVSGNPGANTLTITTLNTYTYTQVAASPYVTLVTDQFIGVDCTVIPITIELPNAPSAGRSYAIKDIFGNAAVNNITVTTVGGVVLIDGGANFVMNTNYESIQVLFTGTFYTVF